MNEHIDTVNISLKHYEEMRNKILELEEDLKIKDIETEAELIEYMAKFFDVPITLISPTKERIKLYDKQWEALEKGANETTKKLIQNLKNKKRLEEK